MTTQTPTDARQVIVTAFINHGSTALQSCERRFTVVEGGRSRVRSVSAPSRVASSNKLSQRQIICMAAVVVVLGLALFCAVCWRDMVLSQQITHRTQDLLTTTCTVTPGDTLWSVAAAHQVPGLSQAQTVDWLLEVNGLSQSSLHPGQTLIIPAH